MLDAHLISPFVEYSAGRAVAVRFRWLRYGLALAITLASSATARAQGTPTDSGAAWITGSLGYANPGTAAIGEAWLRPTGWFLLGGQISNAQQGGFDSDRSTDVYSLVAGLRVPFGPLRVTVAAGRGEATSNSSDRLSGTRAVWTAAADWPIATHFAWHASRFAVVGGQRPYVLTSFGLAIGGVR